jgi:hypothetical protein
LVVHSFHCLEGFGIFFFRDNPSFQASALSFSRVFILGAGSKTVPRWRTPRPVDLPGGSAGGGQTFPVSS